MNLIVFDLEWNIGYQPKTFLYHGTELTLRGEIIQIGAARINDRGDVLDTLRSTSSRTFSANCSIISPRSRVCPRAIWTRACR